MKNTSVSMTNVLSSIYPMLEFVDEPATEEDIASLNFRIAMTSNLLNGIVEVMEENPNFWASVDIADFKKYLTHNKAIVFDMQPYVTEGSKTIAVLDKMKENIRKIEKSLNRATAFNFDLARMEGRLNGEFIELPHLSSAEELRQWLIQQA